MNFNVRLPGPFRVGFGKGGRVSVGVALGPVSASTQLGSGRRGVQGGQPVHPISLDGAVAELERAGWRVTGRTPTTAIVAQGWQAAQIDAVPGGVTWRRVTSRRKVIAWTVAAAVAFLLFVLFAR